MPYALLADVVLVAHFAVVVFVVGGLVVIPLGSRLGWRWVEGWAFRLAHAAAIGVIAAQAWLGRYCPLTVLEVWLRMQAGQSVRQDVSFVQYWLERILYFQAPLWVFALAYTLFGLLVALAWWRYPPRRHHRAAPGAGASKVQPPPPSR
jgi:hypothetical protein